MRVRSTEALARRLAQQRDRYHKNPDKEKRVRKQYRVQMKREAIDAYGGMCACCGEEHIEFLALDHPNGNGKQHRKHASGVGSQFYRWLRRQGWPQGELRVLCHNCNQSLGLYGYCPHRPRLRATLGIDTTKNSITSST
jgi:hypothetical protein